MTHRRVPKETVAGLLAVSVRGVAEMSHPDHLDLVCDSHRRRSCQLQQLQLRVGSGPLMA